MRRLAERLGVSPRAPATAGTNGLDLDLDLGGRPLSNSGIATPLTGLAAVLTGLAILALLLLAGATGGSRRALESARPEALLPPALARSASSSLGARDTSFWPVRRGEALVTRNARIHASFGAAGASMRVDGETLDLSLRSVGDGGRLTLVAGRVIPNERRNRVSYRYGGLSEFYANGPLGIEQGFTLARRRAAGSTLELDLALGGSLSARQAGAQILFTGRAGKTVLRYGDLHAVDATGRRLPSHMRLVRGALQLVIDANRARYPLTIDPFIEVGEKLTGSGETSEGQFGYSLALSSDGDTALIGSRRDGEAGAAFVFTRSGSTWTQQGEALMPTGVASRTRVAFGSSVALSADGNTALIGAPTVSNGLGAAFVFTRTGSTWSQLQELTGAGEAGSGYFGEIVALSADGNTALTGAPREHNGAATGSAFLFTRSGSNWTQQTQIKLSGLESTEELEVGGLAAFGSSAALASEGDTAVIGAPGYGTDKGAAFVFTRSGSSWSEQAKLTGAGEAGEGVFGYGVALSVDGDTVLVGGPQDRGGLGAAWVFTRSGSTWAQQGEKLTGVGESGVGAFGFSVALSSDGDTAVIGARLDDAAQGAAWLFTRSGSTWTQQGEKLTGADESGAGFLGTSVALSSSGANVLIGGPEDGYYSGAAWAFAEGSSTAGMTTGTDTGNGTGTGTGTGTGASTATSTTGTGTGTTTGTTSSEKRRPSKNPHVRIAITHVKVTATAVLVTVQTSTRGIVSVSGDGLQKLVRTLRAGPHKLRLPFTKAGGTLRQAGDTIKLSAGLATAAHVTSDAKRDVKL